MANKVTQVYNDLDRYKPTKNQYTDEQDKRIAEMLKAYDASQNINGSLGINQGHRAGNASQEDILNAQNQAKWDKAINTVGETFSVGGKKDVYGGLTPSEAIYGKKASDEPNILSAYTTTPKTDYSRNANQNRDVPIVPGQPTTLSTTPTTPATTTQDEFSKWYVDEQAKQDEINNEVVETIKKYYTSKSEQEKSFYEQRIGLLQNQYEQNQQALDRAQSRERMEANILHQRMMQYLPEQMKAQGLDGLGISRSMIANAQNQLSSRLGGVNQEYNALRQQGNSEYQQNQMNLMQNYLSNQMNTDQSYEEAMLRQYGNYADRTSALGSQQRNEQLQREQMALQEDQQIRDMLSQYIDTQLKFENGKLTDKSYASAKAEIDNADISSSLKKLLYASLDLNKKAIAQNVGEKVNITFVKNKGEFKPKDTFHVTANGKDYKLNSAGIVDDATIKEIASNYNNREFFVYGDKLYLKHEKGIVQVDTNRDYNELLDIIYPKK